MACRDDYGSYPVESGPKIDALTAMLCACCQQMDVHKNWYIFRGVPGLEAWWMEHRRKDAVEQARVKAEQDKKDKIVAAKSKLTAEERELLSGYDIWSEERRTRR